jgi:hypothetical protein
VDSDRIEAVTEPCEHEIEMPGSVIVLPEVTKEDSGANAAERKVTRGMKRKYDYENNVRKVTKQRRLTVSRNDILVVLGGHRAMRILTPNWPSSKRSMKR